jgi:hypothetical protein
MFNLAGIVQHFDPIRPMLPLALITGIDGSESPTTNVTVDQAQQWSSKYKSVILAFPCLGLSFGVVVGW